MSSGYSGSYQSNNQPQKIIFDPGFPDSEGFQSQNDKNFARQQGMTAAQYYTHVNEPDLAAKAGALASKSSSSSSSTTQASGTDPNSSIFTNDPIRRLGANVLDENQQEPVLGSANPKSGVGPTGTSISSSVPTSPPGPWDTVPGVLKKADMPVASQTTPVTPTAQANAATMRAGTPTVEPPSAPGAGATIAGSLPFAHNDLQSHINTQLSAAMKKP